MPGNPGRVVNLLPGEEMDKVSATLARVPRTFLGHKDHPNCIVERVDARLIPNQYSGVI